MIRLTALDDSQLSIDGTLVVRARRTVAGEDDTGRAKTRIDWAIMSLVKETIDQVAPLVKSELPSFTALTSQDGSKIWFNAKQAVGPLPITPSQQTGGVRSSVKLMGARLFVTETPEEVRAVLSAAGGTPIGAVQALMADTTKRPASKAKRGAKAASKRKSKRPMSKTKRSGLKRKTQRPTSKAKRRRKNP
jgi:hypothetical protein